MDYDIQSVLREWAKMKDLKFTAESEPYRAAWSVLRGCLVDAADTIDQLSADVHCAVGVIKEKLQKIEELEKKLASVTEDRDEWETWAMRMSNIV